MRYLAVALVAMLLCLSILFLRVSPVAASGPTHGCAPAIPPAVAGSPAPAPATPGIIHINEVLTNPASAWNCSETTGGFVIGGSVIDQIVVPQLGSDLSYARFPDGGSKWQTTYTPTIDASNMTGLITPTPTVTATATGSTGGTGGSSYGSGSGSSTTGGSSQTKIVSGTQPRWGAMQVPGAASATATPSPSPSTQSNSSLNNPALNPAPSPTTTASDTPRRILVTVLLLALAATLFWCWRMFSSS